MPGINIVLNKGMCIMTYCDFTWKPLVILPWLIEPIPNIPTFGVPWNLGNVHLSSMELHGILFRFKVPWNSIKLFHVPMFCLIPWHFFRKIRKRFHGISWNLMHSIFQNIIIPNIVFGIRLMIMYHLAKFTQKYRVSYLTSTCHRKWKNVSESGA